MNARGTLATFRFQVLIMVNFTVSSRFGRNAKPLQPRSTRLASLPLLRRLGCKRRPMAREKPFRMATPDRDARDLGFSNNSDRKGQRKGVQARHRARLAARTQPPSVKSGLTRTRFGQSSDRASPDRTLRKVPPARQGGPSEAPAELCPAGRPGNVGSGSTRGVFGPASAAADAGGLAPQARTACRPPPRTPLLRTRKHSVSSCQGFRKDQASYWDETTDSTQALGRTMGKPLGTTCKTLAAVMAIGAIALVVCLFNESSRVSYPSRKR